MADSKSNPNCEHQADEDCTACGPKRYLVFICDGCLAGKGGECHMPGCVFIRQPGPEWDISDQVSRAEFPYTEVA